MGFKTENMGYLKMAIPAQIHGQGVNEAYSIGTSRPHSVLVKAHVDFLDSPMALYRLMGRDKGIH